MNSVRWKVVLAALLVLSAAPASAADPAPPQVGDRAVDDLLRILDEESAIATKTKLNIDFVPGMVTVLHGRDLLAKGIHTVYEALSLVPGFELSMSGAPDARRPYDPGAARFWPSPAAPS